MEKRIFLCGFMGCGKSRVGKTLAKRTGREFADLDSYITEKEGMSIPEIFEKYGEPHFRALEAKYISEMPENSVTALGGGAIINDSTAHTAKQSGVTIMIDTPFEVCYERIKDDSNRPLAFNNPKEKVKELFDKRRGIYTERSDIIVSGEDTPEAIADRITEALDALCLR